MSSRRQRPARRPVPRRRSSGPKYVRSASAAWGRWRQRLRGYRETFPRRRSLLTPSVSAALLASLTTWFTRLLPRTPAPARATTYRRVPRLETLEEKVLLATCDIPEVDRQSLFEYYVDDSADYINQSNPGSDPADGDFVTWTGFDGAPGGGDDVTNLQFGCDAFDILQEAVTMATTNGLPPLPFIRPAPEVNVAPGSFSGFTVTAFTFSEAGHDPSEDKNNLTIRGPGGTTTGSFANPADVFSNGGTAMAVDIDGSRPDVVFVSGFRFFDNTNDGNPAVSINGPVVLSNSRIFENDAQPTALIQMDGGSLDISSQDLEFHATVSGTALIRHAGGSVDVGTGDTSEHVFTFPTNEDTPFDIDLRLTGSNPTVSGTNALAADPNSDGVHTVTPDPHYPGGSETPQPASIEFTIGPVTHTLDITVSPINDSPELMFITGENTYTEDGPGVIIDALGEVSDIDLDAKNNYAGASLIVERQNGASPDDDFGFASNGSFGMLGNELGNVTPGDPPTIEAFASFTDTGGTLTINFTSAGIPATSDLVDAVLQNITYANNSFFPPLNVTLKYTFDDGAAGGNQGAVTGTTSDSKFPTVNINRLPVLSNLNGGSFFTENGVPISVDTDASVADRELDGVGATYNGASLTVRRSGGAQSQDVLSLVSDPSLSYTVEVVGTEVRHNGTNVAAFDYSGGTMTVSFNSATTSVIADRVLRAVTYENTSDAPPEFIFLRYEFNDGFGTTSQDAKVNITRINDDPVFANLDGGAAFVEEDGDPVNVDADVTVSDAELDEANNYAGASVTIAREVEGELAPNSEDVLSIDPDLGPPSNVEVNGNNLQTLIDVGGGNFQPLTFGTFSYSNGTLTINFTSSQTSATGSLVDDTLQHITYDNTSELPPDEVILRYTFSDGNAGAQGGTDPAEVIGTATVDIGTDNDAPELDITGAINYMENAAATLIDATASVSDLELDLFNNGDGDYAGATLTVLRNGGANPDDLFGFDTTGTSFVVNGADLQDDGLVFGTLTNAGGLLTVIFTSTDTPATTALVNEVLSSITYENGSDDPDPDVTLDYTFDDGNTGAQGVNEAKSDLGSATVTIERVNDVPLLVDLTNLVYLLVPSQPLFIDADVNIVDPELDGADSYDGASFTATNAVTPSVDDVFDIDDTGSSFITGSATLRYDSDNTIFATFTNSAGTLTINFNADATAAVVDEVLQRITYENTDPVNIESVDLSYTFSDGNTLDAQGSDANPGQTVQTFTIVNNALPTFADLNGNQTHVEDAGPTKVDVFVPDDPETQETEEEAAVKVADRELDILNNYDGATLTVARNDGAEPEDVLSLDTTSGITISDSDVIVGGNVVATIDLAAQATGTLAITFTGNAKSLIADQIIQAVTYETTNNTPLSPVTLRYTFDDRLGDPSGDVTQTVPINITEVNDRPIATDDEFLDRPEDSEITGNLITGNNGNGVDSDPDAPDVASLQVVDGDTETPGINPISGPSFGTVEIFADGTFTYTPNPDFDGQDEFDYKITDVATRFGNAKQSGTATVFISYLRENDAPVFENLGDPNVFIENGPPIRIDTNATVVDPELDDVHGGSGGDHAGATLTLFNAGPVSPDDVFGFDTSGSFTVSGGPTAGDLQSGGQTFATFTNTAGVLTVSFTSIGTTATAALVDDVLQRLTYENLDPATHTDVDLTFTYDDGNFADAQGTGDNPGTTSDTINVIVNRVPVFDDLNGNETYVEDAGPVLVDDDVTIEDRELDSLAGGDGNYSGATLTVLRQGGANSDDVISIEESGGISIIGSDVIISGNTVATISSGSTLSLDFTSDATTAIANQILQAINYENTNNNPPASVTLSYLFDDGIGTPAGTASGTASIDITPVNDQPQLINFSSSSDTAYTDGGGPVIIDANAAIVDAELDFFNSGAGNYGGSTLTVSGNSLPSTDDSFDFSPNGSFTVLGGTLVANSATIATFTNVAGTLTINFTSDATSALADAVLSHITYEFVGAILPTDVDIDFNFNDGNSGNAQGTGGAKDDDATVNILINELPTFADVDGGETFIEDTGPEVLDENATVADRELDARNSGNGDYNGATLTIARDGGANTEDVFGLDIGTGVTTSGSGVIVGGQTVATISTGGGTLTLSFNGMATSAIADTVIQAINYSNTNNNPPTSVTLLYTFDDGIGAPNPTGMVSDTATINITAANDLPVIDVGPMGDAEFASTAGPVIMDIDGSIADAELDFANSGDGNYAGATLTVERVFGANPDDEFDFDTTGASFTAAGGNLLFGALIFGSFTSSGGTMTISFDSLATPATTALVNDVLQHITYANVSAAPPVNVEIDFTISDGNTAAAQGTGAEPGTASDTVIIKINNPPIFGPGTLNGGNTYTEDGPAVPVDTDVQVADAELDSANSYNGASLTVARDGGANLDDVLTLSSGTISVDGMDIKHSGVTIGTIAGNGGSSLTITLNSNATSSRADQVLQAVNYATPRQDPPASVTLRYTFDDGLGGTVTGTALVNIIAVNDDPVAQDDNFTIDEDQTLIANVLDDNGNGADSDIDGDTLSVNTTPVSGPDNAQFFELLSDGSFTYTPNDNYNGSDSFVYELQDGTTTVNATVNITINPVNDAPLAQDDDVSVDEDTQLAGNVLNDNGNGVDSDVEGDTLTVNTTPTDDVDNGTLVLNSDGTFTYDPDPDFNGTDTFVYEVTDGNGGVATATVTITVNPVADDPVALDDGFTTNEDTQLTGDVLVDNGQGADFDVDGESLTVNTTPVDDVDNGTLVLNSDGSFTYDPDPNFNGTDTFTYEIDDGTGATDTAVATITVNSINDLPVAQDDDFTIDEDDQLAGNLLDDNGDGADSDADNDTLTVDATPVSGPSNGNVVLNPDGSFTYTPNLNFNGSDSFEYQIDDGNGETDIGLVSITINPVNDAPDAVDDAFSVDEDTQLAGNVLNDSGGGEDSDVEGDTLTVNTTPSDDVDNGTLVLNSDGSFTYDPNPDFNGTDSFQYDVDDGNGGLSTATVTITVDPIPDDPIAQDDNFTIDEDAVLSGNVLVDNGNGADSDVDGETLSVNTTPVSGPTSGNVTLNSDGSFTYTPNAHFHGVDTFEYEIDDGTGATDIGLVTVTINSINDVPDAQGDVFSVNEDDELTGNVLDDNGNGPDSDADGDTLTVDTNPVNEPTNGTLVLNADGSFTYNPDPDFNGVDSFEYAVDDGNGGTTTATVTITVNPIPDDPVAVDDAFTTDEDTQLAGNVLDDNGSGEDNDVDGETLTVNTTPIDDVDNGTLVLGSDGTFTYDPDPNFHGVDSFTYEIDDGTGATDTAVVTITVNSIPDDPVAQDDDFSTNEDTQLVGNVLGDNGNGPDSDADPGDVLTVNTTPTDDVDNGTLVLNADGSFTYDPDPNFHGVDSFTYEIDDGTGATDTALVTITVNSINDLPVAQDDAFSTDEDTQLAGGNVLDDNGNGPDSDADGDTLTVNTTPVDDVDNGTLVLNADGTFTYDPDPDFNGVDSFEYEIDDGNTGLSTAIVTITVNAIPDDPVAVDDAFSTNEDTQLNGNVLADNGGGADSDADGETLNVNTTPIDDVDNGTLVLNADGTFTYDPDPNYNGVDTFTYEIDDGTGATDTAIVTITVISIADDPIAVDDAFSTNEDTQLAGGNVLDDNGGGADSDGDGDTLTVNTTPVDDVDNGTLVLNADGTFTYDPDPNYNGVDTFTYEIDDGTGATDTAVVTITVNSINDLPVAEDDAFATNEDVQLAGNVLDDNGNGVDSDVDGDTLTVNTTPVDDVDNGTLVLNSDGTFTYDPDPNFNGVDSFEYEVDDGNSGLDTAVVMIVVNSIPDDPIAVDDAFSTDEDTQLAGGNVLDDNGAGADSDGDGDPLTVNTTPVDDVDSGTLVLNADGTFTYDPDPNFNGVDSFTYEIDDGTGATDTAVVTITVNAINDLPIAANDAFSTNEDTQLAGGNVLDDNGSGADSDVDGDTLTVNTTPVDDVDNGTLVLNADGTFTYDPDPNFNGVDSFTYEVNDGNGGLDTAIVNITVNAVPDDPIALDDDFAIDEDMQLIGNVLSDNGNGVDSDADGETLTVNTTPVSGPANGSVILNSDGSFTYDPTDHFTGVDTFEYELQDGTGATDIGLVTITISSINDVPLFVDLNDDNAWREDLPAASIDPDATIFDPDLDVLNGGLGDFAGASLTISNADGFDPNDAFDINDAGANFNIVGGNLQSGGQTFATFTNIAGTLTIDFTSSGTPATTALVNDVMQRVTYENTSIVLPEDLNISLTVNDGNSADAQGTGDNPGETTQVIHFIINELPVLNNLDGGASYTEDQPPVIVDADVTVDDRELDNRGGSGDYSGATLTVERDGGADAEDVISVEESGGISISGSDVIVGGNTVATIASSGGTMTLAFTADATSAIADQLLQAVNYENSNQDPPTLVTLAWTFNDGIGADPGIASGTTDVTIVPVNDDPTFTSPDAFSVDENTTDVGTVAATDVDGPGPITFTISGGVDQSFFSINSSTGELTFDTPPDFEAAADDDGDNVFLVEVDASDGGTGIATQLISVTVLDVSDVLAVKLGGSAWVQSYRDALDPDAGQGHSVPFGAGQLDTLPWVNLDELFIVFGEDVEIELTDLSLVGVNTADYGPMIDDFSYDSGSFTASWSLDTPIGPDKLLLTLTGVTTVGAGTPVDFDFQFHVLPGDADHDDTVNDGDHAVWMSNFGVVNGNEDQGELNGNGVVTSGDYTIIADNYNDTLPAGEPGGGGGGSLAADDESAPGSDEAYEVSSWRTAAAPVTLAAAPVAEAVIAAPVVVETIASRPIDLTTLGHATPAEPLVAFAAPVQPIAVPVAAPLANPIVAVATPVSPVAAPVALATAPVVLQLAAPIAAPATEAIRAAAASQSGPSAIVARLAAATAADPASANVIRVAAAAPAARSVRLPEFFRIDRTPLADPSPLATRSYLAQPAPLQLSSATTGEWLVGGPTLDDAPTRAAATDRVLAEITSSGDRVDEPSRIDADDAAEERSDGSELLEESHDDDTAAELIDAALSAWDS